MTPADMVSIDTALRYALGEICLICGKDHPGKIRGGKVSFLLDCFKSPKRPGNSAVRRQFLLRTIQRKYRMCPCGKCFATGVHVLVCPVWLKEQAA